MPKERNRPRMPKEENGPRKPEILYELTQQECWEGITCETSMAGTSTHKPRSSKANKGKGYHCKINAVAWQEHQVAHRLRDERRHGPN